MRLLHFIASANPVGGGPIEAAQRLSEVWSLLGHPTDLLTLDPPGSDYLPNYPGNIFSMGPAIERGLRSWYGYSPELVPWLKLHAADYGAIIVHGLWRYVDRAARKVLVGGQTPYFVFPHGMLDPWFQRTYPVKHLGKQVSWWLAEGPLLAHACNVVFTCEEERRLANKAFWPYRASGVVMSIGAADVKGNPAAQIAVFRTAIPDLGERKYLLFLSRFHRKKGIDLLIDAYAAVAATNPQLDLVVAGPDQVGLTPALRKQADRLGIAHRLHFPGMLMGEVKLGAYRSAEAFVLISHQENFGIVVAEALACGTPVLISDKVNIWREVAADGAGLAEPDTKAGAQRLLGRFLNMDDGERNVMGKRARQTFLSRYHIEQAAKGLLELIQSRVNES